MQRQSILSCPTLLGGFKDLVSINRKGTAHCTSGTFQLSVEPRGIEVRPNELITASTRRCSSLNQKSQIKAMQRIPPITVFRKSFADVVNMSSLVDSCRTVIVGAVAAFAPVCTEVMLKSYIEDHQRIKDVFSIDQIVCLTVNDPFVTNAWKKYMKAEDKLVFLSDTGGDFSAAIGVLINVPGLGMRSKRYVMTVTDGKVSKILVEPDGTGMSVTHADEYAPE